MFLKNNLLAGCGPKTKTKHNLNEKMVRPQKSCCSLSHRKPNHHLHRPSSTFRQKKIYDIACKLTQTQTSTKLDEQDGVGGAEKPTHQTRFKKVMIKTRQNSCPLTARGSWCSPTPTRVGAMLCRQQPQLPLQLLQQLQQQQNQHQH